MTGNVELANGTEETLAKALGSFRTFNPDAFEQAALSAIMRNKQLIAECSQPNQAVRQPA